MLGFAPISSVPISALPVAAVPAASGNRGVFNMSHRTRSGIGARRKLK